MDELLGRAWWMLALRGAVGILFGLLALFWPGLTLLLLAAMFAAYALIGSVAAVSAAIRHRSIRTTGGSPCCSACARPLRVDRRRGAGRHGARADHRDERERHRYRSARPHRLGSAEKARPHAVAAFVHR